MLERKFRNHDDPHHRSNWCSVCGLYYCWHKECVGHRNDGRAIGHIFIPMAIRNKELEKKINKCLEK